MYREHLSIVHVQKPLYHQVDTDVSGRRCLNAPPFFMAQADKKYMAEFFPSGSEAERRISFFAQSLTTEIPQPIPVYAMPSFTVWLNTQSDFIQSNGRISSRTPNFWLRNPHY